MKYMIGYDLRLMGSRFNYFRDNIHANFPNRIHLFDSIYVVETTLNANAIRDLLTPNLSLDDNVLIYRLADDWESIGLSSSNIDFIAQ